MTTNMILGALAGYLTFVELTDVTPVPTSETNWIMTRTATASNGINMVSDIRYFNGLGLPVQDVSVKYTPQGNDLVAPVEYDGILRDDARSYLPYPATGGNGAFRANALSAQAQYYQLTFGSEGTRAYSVKEYDPSPLNRVRRTAGPGRLTTDGSVKYVSFEYLGNSSSEVLRLQVNDAGTTLTANGYYPQNTLFKTRAQDEDGNHTEVFTDQEGRTLLSRAFDAAGSRVDTYSVYDDAGRLRWVVAPACSATLGTTTALTQDSSPARDYCYVYRYDDRGNVIEKRLPGKGVECYVYDHADRPVLFQDSLLRESGQWRMISYDPLDRESSRQLIGNPSNRSVLAAWVESGGDPAQHDESSSTQLESEAFYSASRIPSKLAFSAVAGTVQSADTALSSQIRYNRSLVLDGAETDTYEESAYYYDAKGRLVQTVTLNYMGGIDRRSARYDFVGNVLAVVESHRAGPAATEEVMTGLFTYDSRNRLIAQTMSLNGATSASVTYTYDELGRLAGRHFGQGDTAIADNLTYNIRGWLTQQANPQFSMSLRYYDPQQTATTPSYTGNISEWSWQQGNAGNANTYAFTYDGLARLTGAKQYVDGDADDRFVEKGLTYDRNGNLLSLQRTQNGTIADNLTYTYTGNQLTALSGTTAATYTYDGNGNMIHDGANNLNIAYNRLNLIEKAIRNDVVLAKYSYLSDGTKLSATDAAGDGLYYAGSLVYRKQNGAFALEGAAFSGGRFVATNAGFETHYHLTDHLGSVRTIVNGQGEVVERNDYYPFGMRWNDATAQTSDNRYRYNGKENQDFVNVPYLDYGARMYDPRFSVRWNGPDLLAEKYCPISPYAFCNNNPLRFIDSNGLDWYSYMEYEYDDQGNLIGGHRVYEYREDPMLESEMTEKGYTFEGQTAMTTDTYYSLGGAEIGYNAKNPFSMMSLQQIINTDQAIIMVVNAMNIPGDFWKKLNSLIGTGSSWANIVGEYMGMSKSFKFRAGTLGFISTFIDVGQAYGEYQNNNLQRETLFDLGSSIVSLMGVPGAAASFIYKFEVKAPAKMILNMDQALRVKAGQIQDRFTRMMGGYSF